MAVLREERNRILNMVERGQVSAEQAAQLFDTLQEEPIAPAPPTQNRTIRIWITDTAVRSRQVRMTATLPIDVLRLSLQMLTRILPSLSAERTAQIISSFERGATGRVIDVQDIEDGKRVEIFLEQ